MPPPLTGFDGLDKTCQTTDLALAYADRGDEDGEVVLLLHGWPDDATAWEPATTALVRAGYRVIAPSFRGFGATRFLDPAAPRTGNSAVLALDVIELLDALGVSRFRVAGHDWGAIVAEALVVGWPDRVVRLAMLSTQPLLGGIATPPFWRAHLFWYHWFLATERGADAVRKDPRGFARYHWETWSPPGWFDDDLFDRVARSWDHPDWAEVTIHSYRSRWGQAAYDPRSGWLEEAVGAARTIEVPSLYVQGGEDRVNPPAATEQVGAKFSGPFRREVVAGAGHFPMREAPGEVTRLLVDFFLAP